MFVSGLAVAAFSIFRSWGDSVCGGDNFMSVINYLVSRTPGLRMPLCREGVDSLGIKWLGEVLNGKLSVPEAITLARVPRELPETIRRPLGGK